MSAEEATAAGIHMTFAPMVDVAKDARWGRVSEGAGEDTLLNGDYGAAKVRGFQGEDLSQADAMAACLKHFAAYGAGEAGRTIIGWTCPRSDYGKSICRPTKLASMPGHGQSCRLQ